MFGVQGTIYGLLQFRQQLIVNATKSAVGHHQNMVARFRFRRNRIHKLIKILANVQFIAQRCKRVRHVPIHTACVTENYIRLAQTFRRRGFHRAEFHRIGTRF